MKKLFLLVLFVCIALPGCALAAVTDSNQTVAANTTTAPQLIGGDMGTYLVTANVEGANVSFDSDYKGVITDGQSRGTRVHDRHTLPHGHRPGSRLMTSIRQT